MWRRDHNGCLQKNRQKGKEAYHRPFRSVLRVVGLNVLFMNTIFKTEPLTMGELAAAVAVSSVVFWAVGLEELIRQRSAEGQFIALQFRKNVTGDNRYGELVLSR